MVHTEYEGGAECDEILNIQNVFHGCSTMQPDTALAAAGVLFIGIVICLVCAVKQKSWSACSPLATDT